MTGISQYQTVFRVSKNAAPNKTEPKVGKRNRTQVSCIACRARKAKCDRQVPCMQCTKRGDGAACTYPSAIPKEQEEVPRASEAQLRLRKLEQMVNSLMKNNRGSESCESENLPQGTPKRYLNQSPLTTSSGGLVNINHSESSYHGATHWQAILQNIRDIQIVLETEPEENEEISTPHVPKSPHILIDTTDPLTLSDVYKCLPPRHVADKLLSIFFATKQTQIPILHSVKFSREYESFWANPTSVSSLWISALFSIFYIGSQIHRLSGDDPYIMEGPICEDYLRISGRALVAGGYLHARPYSVEATLLYGVVKLCQQQDTDMEAWMIIGVATRLAVKMGYHRDPCHLKDISPFESEMRRRIFYVVEGLDVVLSFQAGLPPILYDQNADTGPPTNLLDTDFDEDCQALPPPRPPTDPTPMLYCCCKRQQVKLLRRVSLHALSFKAPSYEETMKLDSELQDVHANLPLCVRMKPLSSSFSESTQTVMSRLTIELLYHRSICVLHRCYLSYDKTNPAYDYSRRICTGSALQVLKYEAELHLACQPGGRFSKERWITTSLILYDFLLSAMIVSLDLYESCNKMASASREELEIQTRKYDALKQSQVIWTSRKDISRDARHASRVLAVMLSKVPRPNISSTLPINHHALLGEQQGPSVERNVGTLQNPRAPYISTDSNPSPQNLPEYIVDSDSTSSDPLNAIFSESDPIDWELVDQFLLDRAGKTNPLIEWQLPDMPF